LEKLSIPNQEQLESLESIQINLGKNLTDISNKVKCKATG